MSATSDSSSEVGMHHSRPSSPQGPKLAGNTFLAVPVLASPNHHQGPVSQSTLSDISSEAQHVRLPLPRGLRSDGRPVWEPPILDYGKLIDPEDYEKRREALLKYYQGDVAKVTTFLDIDVEADLLMMHEGWAWINREDAQARDDGEVAEFFDCLRKDILVDVKDVMREFDRLAVKLFPRRRGSYDVREIRRRKEAPVPPTRTLTSQEPQHSSSPSLRLPVEEPTSRRPTLDVNTNADVVSSTDETTRLLPTNASAQEEQEDVSKCGIFLCPCS